MLLYDTPEMRARFWSRVNQDPNGCWEWTRSRIPQGYGQFHVYKDNRGQGLRTHRLAWYFTYGPIPDGMMVCHHCDNPGCCRPDHLFLGTAADNVHDMVAKGRNLSGMTIHPERAATGDRHGSRTKPEGIRRGEQQGQSKLTEDDVREIRRLYAECQGSQSEIAARFGVNQTLISVIVRRVRWTHVL